MMRCDDLPINVTIEAMRFGRKTKCVLRGSSVYTRNGTKLSHKVPIEIRVQHKDSFSDAEQLMIRLKASGWKEVSINLVAHDIGGEG